jgi:hypothetical protein
MSHEHMSANTVYSNSDKELIRLLIQFKLQHSAEALVSKNDEDWGIPGRDVMPLGECVPTIPVIVVLLSSRGQAAQIVIKDKRNTLLRNVDKWPTSQRCIPENLNSSEMTTSQVRLRHSQKIYWIASDWNLLTSTWMDMDLFQLPI